MATISLGPFINPCNAGGLSPAGLISTGCSFEFGGDRIGGSFPLFRKVASGSSTVIQFDDYYVFSDQLPLAVLHFPHQLLTVDGMRLLRLECVLAGLYQEHEVRRSLLKVLEEFAAVLPFDSGFSQRMVEGASLIAPQLQQAGFEVLGFLSYGRMLDVRIGWVLEQDRSTSEARRCFHALSIDFRPNPDRSLDVGKWLLPINTVLNHHFAEMLVKLAGREPLDALSPAGKQAALNAFKWTKVSLLTVKQLRAARVEFIRSHPELHQKPKELAAAMKADGLWTDITELHAITKQIVRLRETKVG